MITVLANLIETVLQFLINLSWSLLEPLLDLLPDWTPPDLSGMADTVGGLFQYFAWANNYVPLDQAVIIIGIIAAAWAGSYVASFAIYVLTKLHVLGGSSN